MKIERWECDRCHKASNGDVADWWGITGHTCSVSVYRLAGEDGGKHACGESCALSLVAEMMRGLGK